MIRTTDSLLKTLLRRLVSTFGQAARRSHRARRNAALRALANRVSPFA